MKPDLPVDVPARKRTEKPPARTKEPARAEGSAREKAAPKKPAAKKPAAKPAPKTRAKTAALQATKAPERIVKRATVTPTRRLPPTRRAHVPMPRETHPEPVVEIVEPLPELEPIDIAPWRPTVASRALILVDIAAAFFYLGWWLTPGHEGTPLLFALLAAAEAFNFVHLLGLWWAIWSTKVELPPVATTTFAVDVLIPTYGEPLDVLERTITAAIAIDGEHRTFVLDDARNPEVQALATRLGATYIARAAHTGAKAGNLNHALRLTSGDLVVVFDADHVPHRDFLRRIIGYFEHSDVGFVQTPQYYGNSRTNRVARGAFQQQAIFYGPICRGKNGVGSAFCCGTNVVFRRAALTEVGGFNEKSIVEDFVTSMRIHRRGWRSIYYPYVLAEGLGPTTLRAYFKQQFRWARGSVGAFATLEPFKPGFTLAQRAQYLLATTFYLTGIVSAIYLVLPVLYLTGGWSAFNPTSGTFVFFYAPYLLAALLTIRWGLGKRFTLDHLQFTFGAFPVYAVASLAALVHFPAKFKVTGRARGHERPPLLSYVTIAAFTATGLAVVIAPFRHPMDARTTTTIAWALLNMLMLGGIVRIAVRELREHGNEVAPLADEEPRALVLPEVLAQPNVPLAEHRPWPAWRMREGINVVAMLTAFGFALRLAFIDWQSLRLDESLSLRQAQQPLGQLWSELLRTNVHVPLYHSLLHVWTAIAGTSEWALRVPSVVFGTAVIPMMYLVTRRLAGPRAGIIAAGMASAAPFWVWHSDEARMYPLMLFLVLASTHLLFEALEKGGWLRWGAYAVVTGVSFYSHYFALLMPLVHLAYVLLRRIPKPQMLRWLASIGGAGLMFSPWMAGLYFARIEQSGVASLTNGIRLSHAPYTIYGLIYTLIGFFAVYVIGYQTVGLLSAAAVGIAGTWPLAIFRSSTRPRDERARAERTTAFLLAWIGLTVGVVFLVNFIQPGLFFQKYLILGSAPLFILIAREVGRATRRGYVAVVVITLVFAATTVWENVQPNNPNEENFRAAAATITSGFKPNDAVLVLPQFVRTPLQYYLTVPGGVEGFLDDTQTILDARIPDLVGRHRGASLWVVIDTLYLKAADPDVDPAIPAFLETHFTRTLTRSSGRIEVRRYAL